MTQAETSLKAWKENDFENDRQAVYQLLKKEGPLSRSSVARILGKPIHSISGRFTELKDAGKIEVVGKSTNRFGNKQEVLAVKDDQVIWG